jgi:hypothetical protein
MRSWFKTNHNEKKQSGTKTEDSTDHNKLEKSQDSYETVLFPLKTHQDFHSNLHKLRPVRDHSANVHKVHEMQQIGVFV